MPIIDVINEHVTTLKTIAVELGDLTGKMPYLGRIVNDIVGKKQIKVQDNGKLKRGITNYSLPPSFVFSSKKEYAHIQNHSNISG